MRRNCCVLDFTSLHKRFSERIQWVLYIEEGIVTDSFEFERLIVQERRLKWERKGFNNKNWILYFEDTEVKIYLLWFPFPLLEDSTKDCNIDNVLFSLLYQVLLILWKINFFFSLFFSLWFIETWVNGLFYVYKTISKMTPERVTNFSYDLNYFDTMCTLDVKRRTKHYYLPV